jgi:hypothetical protein
MSNVYYRQLLEDNSCVYKCVDGTNIVLLIYKERIIRQKNVDTARDIET